MKNVYVSSEQKRDLILSGNNVPTAIFVAQKNRAYVSKARGTIFGKPKSGKYLKIDKL